jgi:hypothetical protein
MNIKTITRNPFTWIITYKWMGGSTTKNTRTVQVNSSTKPTRSTAMRYAKDDLVNFLGHTHGQYGYRKIKIDFIGKISPVLTSTKQKAGTAPAIAETTYAPSGSLASS